MGLAPARDAAAERTRNSIAAEAILGHEAGQAVSYSRRKEFYNALDRYRGTGFTFRNVLTGVADWADAGFIEDHRVAPGNLGWQSSFCATAKLIEASHETSQEIEYRQGEIILLKGDDNRLINYRDTHRTRRQRRQMEARNDALAGLKIEVPAGEWHGRHLRFSNGLDDDGNPKYSYVLPTPGNGMVRVFSRGSFSCHGRMYGWFQGIPRDARDSMTLNGERVCSLDYSSLHITMLYNEAGIKIDGNPYEVPGFDPEQDRNDIKLATNISLNARTKQGSIMALRDHLQEAEKKGKRSPGKSSHAYAAKVVDAIQSRHKPIEAMFGSDAGIRLMNRDSELIGAALDAVSDNGIPALPIHDALIVPARNENRTFDIMKEAFAGLIHGPNECAVKVTRPTA